MTLTQPLKWHGGKHYLAPWIISHFPPHIHYVEPYFGGGSVLLSKPWHKISEVANDINKELINFWLVLQRKETLAQLQRLVEATPFCEGTFEDADPALDVCPCDDPTYGDRVTSAWRFFIRARQSRQGLMKDFATLSRNRTRRGMNEQVSSWLTAIDGLPEIHERLKRVVILNQPALDVVRSQDGPNTLFYLDPPYLHTTRVTTSDYKYEMTEKDHDHLLVVLSWIKGKFVLSGYPSSLYEKKSAKMGWHRVERQIDNKASSASEKELKTECLWMNFVPRTLS